MSKASETRVRGSGEGCPAAGGTDASDAPPGAAEGSRAPRDLQARTAATTAPDSRRFREIACLIERWRLTNRA